MNLGDVVLVVQSGVMALSGGGGGWCWLLISETGRLQDWKDFCYYCCYEKEREMERCGFSQGLDLGGWLPADRCGSAPQGRGLTAWGTQQLLLRFR
jgi:hypothetical protein